MRALVSSTSDEIKIVRRGSKERGLFFGIMGLVFQIIFVWGYWSFLDETGPWAIVWLTIINSEFFPYTFILFVFGAGCILLALREIGWKESLAIRKNLVQEISGIRKELRLFWWSRTTDILKNQIVVLRLHSILLDEFGVNKSYQIEVDYQENSESVIETLIMYKEHIDKVYEPASRLAIRIQEILSLAGDIEKTESQTFYEIAKKGKGNNSKEP
jgi:hypothetical protein